MSKVQTDNDEKYYPLKIKIRLQSIDKIKNPVVLDCFSGDGTLWKNIKNLSDKEIKVLRIETKQKAKGVYLKGDNKKFLKTIDLKAFDIIDLDAYGIPCDQLDILFKRNYKGIVIVTAIQSMLGQLPVKMLKEVGYSKEMIKKCPTLFSKKGKEILKQWLAFKGVKEVYGKLDGRKNYFYFEVK